MRSVLVLSAAHICISIHSNSLCSSGAFDFLAVCSLPLSHTQQFVPIYVSISAYIYRQFFKWWPQIHDSKWKNNQLSIQVSPERINQSIKITIYIVVYSVMSNYMILSVSVTVHNQINVILVILCMCRSVSLFSNCRVRSQRLKKIAYHLIITFVER